MPMQNRREFLRTALGAAGAWLVGTGPAFSQPARERPNILFIMVDQKR
jgi:hypothetical protein